MQWSFALVIKLVLFSGPSCGAHQQIRANARDRHATVPVKNASAALAARSSFLFHAAAAVQHRHGGHARFRAQEKYLEPGPGMEDPEPNHGLQGQATAPNPPAINPVEWMDNESFLGKYGLLIIAVFVVVVPATISFISIQLRGVHIASLGGMDVKGVPKPNWYMHLFLGHRNHVFAADAELAVRAGAGCVLVALPMLLPDTQYWIHEGRYGFDVAVMLVFTIYKSVGETMNFAFMGVSGVFLAVFNAWLLNGFFPAGVTTGSGDAEWWVGVIDGVAFIVFILGFNFDMNLRMFALSWHVWFFMGYMNPANNSFNTAFSLEVTGPALSALISSCIGAGVAIVVTIVPFPIFALDRARAESGRVIDTLTSCWQSSIECYCHDHKMPILEDSIYSSNKKVHEGIANMSEHTVNAWWECFGKGRPEKVRVYLTELREVFIQLQSRVVFILDICRQEGFEQTHVELMTAMKPHLSEVCQETTDLLYFLNSAASDGALTEEEKLELHERRKKVQSACTDLTAEFHSAKHDFAYEMLGEHAFCMAWCAYGRIVVEFSGFLEEKIEAPGPRFFADAFNLVRLRDPTVFNCFLRNTVSVLLAFLIGYHGYSAAIPAYNAAPSCTASLLLSSGLGASMSKSLQRMQGVVLGTVIGQLAYAFLAWCSVWGFIKVGVFLFVWCGMTLFMYYNSKTFSLMGCLLAAFGAKAILKGCSDDVYQALGIWNQVIGCTLGILTMTAVDAFLSHKRPSEEAYDALLDAWTTYKMALMKLFDPAEKEITFHSGSLRDKWLYATAAGYESIAEPRFWRTEWKQHLFSKIVSEGIKLHEALCNMECSFSKTNKDGGAKSQSLLQITEVTAFRQVKSDMEDYFKLIDNLLGVFMHETESTFKGIGEEAQRESQDELFQAKEHVAELLERVRSPKPDGQGSEAAKAFTRELTEASSLEFDVHCKLATIVITLENQLSVIFTMKHAILSD